MKDKNRYGQYFTHRIIAEFMAGMITHDTSAKVLEPSCGKGVFLEALAGKGYTDVDAYEIDKSLGAPAGGIRYESFVSSPMDKYDVVIGNPPYIRWKNLEDELKSELEHSPLWQRYFNSLCDYMFIFILKSIEQLIDGGELIFICSDYWINTTHSATLRDYMAVHGYFSDIYHFREAPLFDGVNASLMIFRYVKSAVQPATIRLYDYNDDKHFPDPARLAGKECFTMTEIPQFKAGARWLLAGSETQELLKSFETSCAKHGGGTLFGGTELHRIGEYCDIGNGMVSGLDKAFNLGSLPALNEAENESTLKVLKAKDLRPYVHGPESRYFFINSRVTEDEFERSYPNVCRHLAPYRQALAKRYDYGKDIPYWEFVFPRNYKLFARDEKRIFVPCKERISNKQHFRFTLADKDYMPLQDVTGILKKNDCRESIEYLTAYLNNHRVFEWLKYNGITKGYIVEFSEAPIASIPYRPIRWDNISEQAIHDKITENVRRYVATKDMQYINDINDNFNTLFS